MKFKVHLIGGPYDGGYRELLLDHEPSILSLPDPTRPEQFRSPSEQIHCVYEIAEPRESKDGSEVFIYAGTSRVHADPKPIQAPDGILNIYELNRIVCAIRLAGGKVGKGHLFDIDTTTVSTALTCLRKGFQNNKMDYPIRLEDSLVITIGSYSISENGVFTFDETQQP